MKRAFYRCRQCRARRVLRQPLAFYLREPHCQACGGTLLPDIYRTRTHGTVKPCCCDGYHFPHKRGSRYCRHGKGRDL